MRRYYTDFQPAEAGREEGFAVAESIGAVSEEQRSSSGGRYIGQELFSRIGRLSKQSVLNLR